MDTVVSPQDFEYLISRTEDEQQVVLARSFAWEFCLLMDPDFFTSREEALQPIVDAFQYLIQWDREEKVSEELIDRIRSNKYVEVFNENPENVGASISPRAGKSYSMSLCCAWALGKYNNESIMRVSHAQKLYNKFSRNVRYFITTNTYQSVFPGTALDPNNSEVAGWSLDTSKQGAYFGSGVGGSIIGFGASLVAVTDDLYKSHTEAMSPAVSETTDDFMESAFDSRKEKKCKQFDLGTRWTKKDYMGKKLENEEYDIFIKVPALDENGETFCEDVKTTRQYLNTKARLERNGKEEIWESEYMQEPIETKGLLFPKAKMKRFRMADLNMENVIGKVTFVDTADEGTDFYSAPVGYITPSEENVYDVYIPKVIFTKKAFKYTEPRQVAMIVQNSIDHTFIETNKEGSLYVNNIRKQVKPLKVRGIRQPSNVRKLTRILVEAGYILDFHYLEDDEQDKEYKAYFENLTSFLKEGNNEHDDAPDSTAGLSKGIRRIFKALIKKKYGEEVPNDDTDTQKDEEM